MPFQKLLIPPGVIREITQYASENAGWFDSDKVRFRKGFPEKISGWEKYFPEQLTAIPRSFHIWRLLDGRVALAIGTEEKAYVYLDGQLKDITPLRFVPVTLALDSLSTTYNSDIVTIHHNSHGFLAGDSVTLHGATAIGGISAASLNRTHTVETATIDEFTIKMRPPEDGQGVPIPGLEAEIADEAWNEGGGKAGQVTRDVDGTQETYPLLEDPVHALAGVASGGTDPDYNVILLDANHGLDVGDDFVLSNIEGFSGIPASDFNKLHVVTERVSLHEIGFDVATTPELRYGGGALMELSGDVKLNGTPFMTTTGSKIVTVLHTGHGADNKAYVTFSGASSVGGIPAGDLNKEHQITSIVDNNQYTIEVDTAATSNASGGGVVVAEYQINPPSVFEGDSRIRRIWSFDNWGEDLVLNSWGESVYRWDATYADNNALILAGAPRKSQLIKVTDTRHLACFGCSQADDRDSELDTLHIQWCSQENLDDWDITDEFNSAGDFLLTGGSQILAAAKVEGQVLIWTEEAVHGMLNVGPPVIFQFDQLGTATGIIGPNAWATHNGMTFWMGDSAFYVYHGGVAPVVCSVQDFVFAGLDFVGRRKVFAGVDRRNDEISWYYPTEEVEDTKTIKATAYGNEVVYVENTAGYPAEGVILIDGTEVTYTSKTDAAFHGCSGVVDAAAQVVVTPTEVTQQADAGSREPCRYATFSLKENIWWIGRLERSAWIDRGAVPHPIAARPDGYIFEHEVTADADGEPLAALVESAEFDIGEGDQLMFMRRFVPDFQFRGGSVEVCLRMRYWPHSKKLQELVGVVSAETEKIDTRIRGRQASFKVRSFDTGDAWRMGANRLDVQPDGKKN